MADHTHADEMSLEDIKKNYKFYGEKDYRDKRVQIFNSLYRHSIRPNLMRMRLLRWRLMPAPVISY